MFFLTFGVVWSILNEPNFEGDTNIAVTVIKFSKHIKKCRKYDGSGRKPRNLDWNQDVLFRQWMGNPNWTVLEMGIEADEKSTIFCGR